MTDQSYSPKSYIHKTQPQIALEVISVAIYYPGMVKVYVPNVPINKNLPDWELDKATRLDFDKAENKTSNETDLERSIRRSKKLVNDYMLCNQFELFGTFTIGVDHYDNNHSKNKLKNWLKNQRDRNGRFKYVVVPELHKDGAIHFHVVLDNYSGKLKKSRSSKTNKLLHKHGKPVYEFDEYKSGFTEVQYIGQTAEDHAKINNYIRKYIKKDMVTIFGKKRYWASQGLKKPIREDNPQWYMDIEADDKYTNDYGTIYTYINLEDKPLPTYVESLTGTDRL